MVAMADISAVAWRWPPLRPIYRVAADIYILDGEEPYKGRREVIEEN